MAKLPAIVIPTGYESDQVKAANKRKLAQMMLEKGLSSPGGMQSWLQVLGQLGSTAAGLRMNKQADDMDEGTNKRILADYVGQLSEFHNDEKTMAPKELVAKYRDKPFLEDALKPYTEAMTARLRDKGDMVNINGTYVDKGSMQAGGHAPTDPNAGVIRDASGNLVENMVRRNAALHAQGYGLGDPATTMPDPGAPNGPAAPVSGTVGGQTPPMGGAPAPSGDGLDLSLLSADERGIMQRELQRRAANGGAFQPPNPNVPLGSPLTAQRAPAGIVAGKPYWLINGVPYDNPEGK